MRLKSITTRIVVLIVPALLITVGIFVASNYSVSTSRINETVNDRMYESLHAADLEIQLELFKNASVAERFASRGKALKQSTFNDAENKSFLEEGVKSNRNTFGGGIWFEPFAFDPDLYHFGSFLYVDEYGIPNYASEYSKYVDYFTEDWYIKGKYSGENEEGDVVWSKAYNDPYSNTTMITASKPFYNEKGEFIGLGTADMNIENISSIVEKITVAKTGKAFIIGAKGEYLSFFGEDKSVYDSIQFDEDPELAQLGAELTTNDSGMATLIRDGEAHRVYYMTMEGVEWTLAVMVDESEVKESTFTEFMDVTYIPIVGLVFVMSGIYYVVEYLQRIIKKVNNFADMAASGDFSKRIDVTEADEFGYMEQRLNIMIASMKDMSEHQAELLEIAENASKSKSEFLSRMSHEIRTPMNAIIGMTQIAKASGDPERVKDCLTKIETASDHLLELINDVLDMSKIEANKLELSSDEFSPEQAIDKVCEMMLVKAEEKNQKLTYTVEEDVPTFVLGDKLRFSQVITNLVGNAIKFTPENGEISVTMSSGGEENDVSVIKVCVKDSGIGLSDEQSEKVFNSFEQGDGSVSRKFGGTGLGLAISKRIVELMGGKIWVVSEKGKGSEFMFTVRVKKATGTGTARVKPVSTPRKNIKELKILIVDDSVESVEYMSHILGTLKLSSDTAYSGAEAIELVKKAVGRKTPYDVIFMDYLMPGMDGIEASKIINGLTDKTSSIIMVSMYDWKEISEEAFSVGISRNITKPFSPSSVADCISEATSGVVKRSYPGIDLSEEGFGGRTILLAEDMEINREILAALLEDTHVAIEYAENGVQVLEMFGANPDKYDLILMDVQMPEMDGLEATRRLRNLDIRRAKTIPIIAMTANALSEDVVHCKEAGMNDHIAKPIEYKTLVMKLNDYFFMKDFLNKDIF